MLRRAAFHPLPTLQDRTTLGDVEGASRSRSVALRGAVARMHRSYVGPGFAEPNGPGALRTVRFLQRSRRDAIIGTAVSSVVPNDGSVESALHPNLPRQLSIYR